MTAAKVLVVEDEAIIAMSIQDMLLEEGFDVIGPAGSVAAALALLRNGEAVDCALLDVNLRGETVYPVASELSERSIPFAFTSGYGQSGIDPRFAGRVVLPKPVDPLRLVAFLKKALVAS